MKNSKQKHLLYKQPKQIQPSDQVVQSQFVVTVLPEGQQEEVNTDFPTIDTLQA